MTSLLWFIVCLLLLGVQRVLRPGFHFGCLALGALAAAAAALLGAGPGLATVVFFGVSILALQLGPPLVRRWAHRAPPRQPVSLDAVPGQRARVTERLDPAWGTGMVRFATGEVSPAGSDQPIPVDAWVEVVAVDGNQLWVRPLIPPKTGA